MTIAALVASCNKAEVIRVNRQAIAFGEAFVDNATKADYSTQQLKAFQVWGTVSGNNNTVNIFNKANVTDDNNVGYGRAWNCDQTEYWVPSCSYAFTAIADATSVTTGENDMPTAINYTVANDKDLLLSTATATTDASASPSVNPVSFTFRHLLSKVFFTFRYGVEDNTKYSFEITSVSISDLTAKGIYTLGTTVENGTWAADGTDVTTLSFGAGTANVTSAASTTSTLSHQVLPLTETAQINVTYDILYNGTKIMVGETQTATMTDQAFAQNTVYNINITLPAPGAPIQFSVTEVGGFAETTQDVTPTVQ